MRIQCSVSSRHNPVSAVEQTTISGWVWLQFQLSSLFFFFPKISVSKSLILPIDLQKPRPNRTPPSPIAVFPRRKKKEMASEQNDTSLTSSETTLCANGCGFFGTAANMNLCSKCYRDIRAAEEQAAKAKVAMEKSFSFNSKEAVSVTVLDVKAVEESGSSSSVEPVASAEQEAPKRPGRCLTCNKKVGLTGFKCKCGSMFCGEHRYPEKHECSFNFKSSGRDAIAKANPVVKADKVERF